VLVNVARSWNRRHRVEQHGAHLLGRFRREGSAPAADVPSMLDVRAALRKLPYRRRACVVLRYAFDLPEREVAAILDISIGTVKSQTSRGAAQLAALIAPDSTGPKAILARAATAPGPNRVGEER
jgi:DNA-directed RNA polymerase specialized sigma24 family protein